jgi:hypothetical protein
MSSPIIFGLFVLPILAGVGILILVLVFGLIYLSKRAQDRAWSDLATRTGLTHQAAGFPFGPSAQVTGLYRGRQLFLDTFVRRAGKHSQAYTRIRLAIANQLAFSMELSEQGLLGELSKLLGARDIVTGDADLDQRFVVKGQPESAVVDLLRSGVGQRLREARALYLRADGQELYFKARGTITDVSYLQSLFDLFVDVAEAIDRGGGTGGW